MAVGHLELKALVPDLPEEARILDGQSRLAGEGLEQVDHLRRKFPGRLLVDGESPDQMVLAEERDAEERPGSRPQEHVA